MLGDSDYDPVAPVFGAFPRARRYHDLGKRFDREAGELQEWTEACKAGAREKQQARTAVRAWIPRLGVSL